MKLLLFDIDGTLLSTSGAGIKAADMAFEKIYNIKNVMSGIKTDGKTDPMILKEMFAVGLKREYLQSEADLIFDEYVWYLDSELLNGGKIDILPGIYELLTLLSNDANNLLGLATGNIKPGAWLKLRHSGLDKFFKFGGFGSDSEYREKLIRKAIERSRDYCHSGIDKIYVIGDTPLDIIHGSAAGAITVAVATGRYTKSELLSHKPDYIFDNLHNSMDFLDII